MSKQDLLKVQSCILKVNIHCDGCEHKVKKLLQKIDGVYSVNIDAEQGKVLVAGNVDPAKLIKKLKRSGKHAEIWGGQRDMMYNQNYPFNNQFQNLQVDTSKGGKDNKSQNQKGQKGHDGGGGGGHGQLAHFQNVKGPQGLKVPPKEHKSVKFNIPQVEFDASDVGSDEFDDNFDDYDEEEEEGYGHNHPMPNKMMPVMKNGGEPHGPSMNNHKGNGAWGGNYGSEKKGDFIGLVMPMKGKDGNSNEAKNGNQGGKKSNGDPSGKNKKWDGGNSKKKNRKSDGGLLGRFLGFGKKNKNGEVVANTNTNTNKNSDNGGGYNKGKEEGKGGGKLKGHGDRNKNMSKNDTDFFEFDIPSHDKNGKSGKGSNGNENMGQMGPMGQMGNIPAGQGLPAMNGGGGGGYYQGMQMQPPPHNLQQQQYMAMMMNQQQQQQQQQQHANMNNMATMYDRPHPSMNYMPPPPMPSHPMADPITHTFSDENVESCSVM